MRENFFVVLAIIASFIRYSTYALSIYRKQTKPHVFSWFNWGLLVTFGAVAQYRLEGGASVWGLTFVAATCFLFAIWALFVGEKNITRSDWATFVAALIVIVIWQITANPFLGVVLIILIDLLTYWPTIRKSWDNPWGEPPVSYFWAGLRYFFLLFAVPNPNISNLLYPFWLMATDWGFALYVVARRSAIGKSKS